MQKNAHLSYQIVYAHFGQNFDTAKTKEMKRDTTPKSASGKLLRHAGQAVTNEAVAAAASGQDLLLLQKLIKMQRWGERDTFYNLNWNVRFTTIILQKL